MENQSRFDILRGYYQDGKFHPQGGLGIGIDELLNKMEFKKLDEFLVWYKSLAPEEIKNGKKDWCPGNCCQSNLSRLLKLKR